MTTYTPGGWFSAIATHVNAVPDRKGEAWIVCPNCGKGSRHFSFSERGAKCFACGFSPSLKALAEQLGVAEARPYAPPVKPRIERKPRPWQERAGVILRDLGATPGLERAWQQYKPLKPAAIHNARLGYGPFPGGLAYQSGSGWQRCDHPRLIVPLFHRQAVVGFRCRAIECDCPKWLSPGGSQMTLYNAHALKPGVDVLVICENPVDALLVGQEWEGAAVATLGVSIWNDEYTAIVKAAAPEQVVVWFDNDTPGQATNPAIIAAWQARRRARSLPADETQFLAGIKLANRLLQAGLNATFYRWPDDAAEGADIGYFFK